MTKHDEVVQRMARAIFQLWFPGDEPDVIDEEILNEAAVALAAIKEGDSLGNGLWAAPEEPTNLMLMKATQTLLTPDIGVRKCRRVYEAMRRAAGGGDE